MMTLSGFYILIAATSFVILGMSFMVIKFERRWGAKQMRRSTVQFSSDIRILNDPLQPAEISTRQRTKLPINDDAPSENDSVSGWAKQTEQVFHGRRLMPDEAVAGAYDLLIDHVERKKPDYLIGVNNGGMHVASFVASKLKLPESSLYQLGTNEQLVSGSNSNVVLYLKDGMSNIDVSSASVMFVDDIVRTGNTLKMLKKHYQSEIGVNPNLSFAVLFCAAAESSIISFSAKFLENENYCFRWSPIDQMIGGSNPEDA